MNLKQKLKNLILSSSFLSEKDKESWISYLKYLSERQITVLTTEIKKNPGIIEQLNSQLKKITKAFDSDNKKEFYKIMNLD